MRRWDKKSQLWRDERGRFTPAPFFPRDERGRFIKKVKQPRDERGRFTKKVKQPRDERGRFTKKVAQPKPSLKPSQTDRTQIRIEDYDNKAATADLMAVRAGDNRITTKSKAGSLSEYMTQYLLDDTEEDEAVKYPRRLFGRTFSQVVKHFGKQRKLIDARKLAHDPKESKPIDRIIAVYLLEKPTGEQSFFEILWKRNGVRNWSTWLSTTGWDILVGYVLPNLRAAGKQDPDTGWKLVDLVYYRRDDKES
jgi:hypothetical protein